MKELANKEIVKQLVNGSDDKYANQSIQTQQTLTNFIYAGQILNYTGEKSSKSKEVCQWLYDLESEITPRAMQMKAEGLKLYNCKFTPQMVKDVNSIFKKMNSVTDYYSASIINNNLEENR